ncbi:hypothetical protein [Fusibacter ferrireducens]|uniref:Uncharacterized protein n=1 Tax=Fusibacter ferrireducens TaxID=2785058 RepID=A0ABR9ZNK2_9FIRM|nr:hypothetical protein [Fusibacter ferrireducens]MBF4692021.1 hypothetical protein [Fusibacter ferrireducens]
MHMPAFCDNCGAIFKSGFEFENCRLISLRGNKSGPCPSCGGMGHIPDGVFNFLDGTIELLSGPYVSQMELERLSSVIRASIKNKEDINQIQERIENESGEVSKLADLLPHSRSELYAFLTLILVIIQILMSNNSVESSTVTTNNIMTTKSESIITEIYNDYTLITNQYIINQDGGITEFEEKNMNEY